MKAKIEVNESIIEQALVAYFAHMKASKAELKSYENTDERMGSRMNPTIFAVVEIDVGEAVAQ